jgi:glutamate racemase
MTVARNSQTVVEVLRTNTDVKARASQTVVEVLRTNTAVKARASQTVVEVLRQNNAEAPIGGGTQPLIIICC